MQIVIIGGGVVGLNIALCLSTGRASSAATYGRASSAATYGRASSAATYGRASSAATCSGKACFAKNEIYLLEQEEFLGHHTSTRNSEVIHAGFAYPKESLKAKLCVEGNKLTYELLDRLHVPYKKCGKWVIACNAAEEKALATVEENARICGVEGFKRSRIQEFKKAEPEAQNVTAAAFSASSGIMDTAAYIRALEVALSSKANIIYPCRVTDVDATTSTIETTRGPMQYELLINSGGLWADDIYNMKCRHEDFSVCSRYQIIPFKGEYYTWRKGRVQTMIYPVPRRFLGKKEAGSGEHGAGNATLVSSMGIHTHRNVAGDLFVGPTQVELTADKKSDYTIQTPPTVPAEAISHFVKNISAKDLEPAFAGNRPKLYEGSHPVGDFQIFREGNIIHLLGIESPGLTAAPAIAKYVAGMI